MNPKIKLLILFFTLYISNDILAITSLDSEEDEFCYEIDFQHHCDSFTWINGITYTVSNSIEAVDTIFSSSSCDSIITLDLTIIPSSPSLTYYEEKCDSHEWKGSTYNTSGIYYYYNSYDQGCGIETLELTINNSANSIDNQEHCESFLWNGTTYTESGTYNFITSSSDGCDSTATLNLTIIDSPLSTTSISACQEYEWNGTNYTESGTYDAIFSNSEVCDSTARLILQLDEHSYAVDIQEHCSPFTWVDGVTYTESNSEATYTLANAIGCDSIITLNLTISEGLNFPADTIESCNSFYWNGTTYNSSGTYTFTNESGCINETLNLTILENSYSIDSQTHCESFMWLNGITYSEDNNSASIILDAANGCDSVITLNLDILETSLNTISDTACNSYTWNETTYTTSGIYEEVSTASNGCDSLITLNLIVREISNVFDFQIQCQSFTWIDGITYDESNNSATYTLTDSFGCDSIVNLDLTIMDNFSSSNDTVEACNNFSWNGSVYDASGTYIYNSPNGCIKDTLHLQIINNSYTIDTQEHCGSYTWTDGVTYFESNNTATVIFDSSNGCDSIITLNLTLLDTSITTTNITACEEYVWNGTTYSESDIYEEIFTSSNGCDSLSRLDLTIRGISNVIDFQEHCGEFTWIDGITYDESNNEATYILADSYGCDSIVTLSLEINEITNITYDTVSVCEAYEFYGITYDTSGTYTILQDNNNSCQKTILELSVFNTVFTSEYITACQTFEWNGEVYNESGTYTQTLSTTNGCDSIVSLNLTVNNGSTSSTTSITACNNYTWNGTTYNESGTYTINFNEESECDSTAILILNINNSSAPLNDTVTACDNYSWNGETYTESGIYTYSSNNTEGCDSLATLFLTINNSYQSTEDITACDSYDWNGSTFTESGEYSFVSTNQAGCDSTLILELTINNTEVYENDIEIAEGESITIGNQTYDETGIYTDSLLSINGCDSIIITNLTIIPKSYNCNSNFDCTDPGDGTGYFQTLEACIENCVTSVVENESFNFNIYPNPFSSETNLEFQNSNREKLIIRVIDIRGRILREYKNVTSNHYIIKKESLTKGMYYIQIESKSKVVQKPIVIE
jgi:trimeric autotransporter adhesin